MKYRTILTLALFLAFAAGTAAATDAQEAPGAGPGTARSPGDMSVDERVVMMEAANAYNTCVYTEAMDKIDSDPDIRRIADLAMGHCQPRLDALHGRITGWGFEPYFAQGFTRNVRDRAARKLLPELAIRKSR